MGRSSGSSIIGLGDFVQVPVVWEKATKVEGQRGKLHTVCSCGAKPKMDINCPKCAKKYSSWQGVPDREFDAGSNVKIILTKDEIDAAKSSNVHDMMQVEKIVSLSQFASRYILSEPKYLLPDADAPGAQKKAYRTIVLACEGKVMLTRYTNRGISKRYAIVGDTKKNVLVAYEVDDAKPVSVDIPKEPIDAKSIASAKALLAASESEDIEFVADPDPIEELISNKIDEQMRKGGLS